MNWYNRHPRCASHVKNVSEHKNGNMGDDHNSYKTDICVIKQNFEAAVICLQSCLPPVPGKFLFKLSIKLSQIKPPANYYYNIAVIYRYAKWTVSIMMRATAVRSYLSE